MRSHKEFFRFDHFAAVLIMQALRPTWQPVIVSVSVTCDEDVMWMLFSCSIRHQLPLPWTFLLDQCQWVWRPVNSSWTSAQLPLRPDDHAQPHYPRHRTVVMKRWTTMTSSVSRAQSLDHCGLTSRPWPGSSSKKAEPLAAQFSNIFTGFVTISPSVTAVHRSSCYLWNLSSVLSALRSALSACFVKPMA